jgi:hypothetical protein
VKPGDLVRYDPGPNWTAKEKKDNCAVGLVIKITHADMSAQIRWTSHQRSDISWETVSALELISEAR